MNLYIQIQNGVAINHPAFDTTLITAYGTIPSDWESFVRVERPTLGIYQVLESETPEYKKTNEVWSDVWLVRDMTAEEKAAKQNSVKEFWATQDQSFNWTAWVFNEEICDFEPPTPRPETGSYSWCGAEGQWKIAPKYPKTGGEYKFDYAKWEWVAL